MSLYFSTIQQMPAPACTEDGKCKMCGTSTISHSGTCDWSVVRSGQMWEPKPWREQSVKNDEDQ